MFIFFGSVLFFSCRILFVSFCSLLFIFCFFSVENFIAKILKYNLPDSHHWLREGYLFFSFCQSSQKFWNIFWKGFCFKIEVFNFQYPVPEALALLIFIFSWIASWSERPFGTMKTFCCCFLIICYIESIYSTMYLLIFVMVRK